MKSKNRKKTVVVLGVARSGTSTVAGILSILGVEMRGSTIPLPVVPKGSFEDPDFARLIESILKEMLNYKDHWDGSAYWEVDSVNSLYSLQKKILEKKSRFDEEIKNLVTEKSKDKEIWGWKYPGSHLVTELFLPYLKNPYFIICLRDPLKIARSSQAFFKLMNIQKSISLFEMLRAVNVHNQIILDFLNRHPSLPRIFVSFEDVISNPIKESRRLADFLGLELTEGKIRKIRKFVIPRDRIRREKKKAAIKHKLYLFHKGLRVLRTEGPFVFLKKVARYLRTQALLEIASLAKVLFFKIFSRRTISRIKKFSSSNPEKVFRFAQDLYFSAIKPMQVKEEFIKLLKTFQELNPRYIMEIGTANGGTLFCFCKLAREDARIISIDLPQGKFGGGYPEYKIPIYKSFAKEGQKLHLLREDSHKQVVLEKVKNILGGNKLDFLFIDGDHSYEGVKKDFEMYGSLVGKGGIIAFHDISFLNEESSGGVPKFWEEIRSNYNYKEFVKDWKAGYGIGIIYKD